jgi:hypothetical protein
MRSAISDGREGEVPDHPYQNLPDYCFWRRSIGNISASEVDPVVRAKFKIDREQRVATAGSCFAQHIARHLPRNGFNYFVTEQAHPLVAHLAGDYSYGVFTARYGNIYTARQLWQTLQRAYGLFDPRDSAWPVSNGRVNDPYRPQIQPNGFASLQELARDRLQHFAAIRRAVEELDVFVFTLGLTEAWFNRADGAVYPLCPGVAGGVFNELKHGFVNFSVRDVVEDLKQAFDFIVARNSNARFILTVSPVPLIATAENRSVLVSTAYSKSVLRVAAEEIAAAYDQVAYFPSYEIVTGNFSRGGYFGNDLREITEEGVSRVMKLFLRHFANAGEIVHPEPPPNPDAGRDMATELRRALEKVAAVLCDEESLDRSDDKHESHPALALVEEADSRSVARSSVSEPLSAMAILKGANQDRQQASVSSERTAKTEAGAKRRRWFFEWFRRS